MAAALPFVAAGMQVAGTLLQAKGEHDQLKAAAKADEANARNATLSGEIEATQIRGDARAVEGEAIVAQAVNGGGIGTGSAADLLTQSAIDAEYAVLTARYNADSQAQQLYKSAKVKRKAARGAMFQGILRAGAQAISAGVDAGSGGAVSAASGRYTAAAQPTGGLQLPTPKGP